MKLGLDAGILAKDAMRHFRKIANRLIIACAGKIFCENPGKNFRENCFGEMLVKSIIAGDKIFAMEFRGGGGSRVMRNGCVGAGCGPGR